MVPWLRRALPTSSQMRCVCAASCAGVSTTGNCSCTRPTTTPSRAGAGFGAAIYDPAARGFLTDATPPERRGEAFGLYGAAQMGGLLLPLVYALMLGTTGHAGIGFLVVLYARDDLSPEMTDPVRDPEQSREDPPPTPPSRPRNSPPPSSRSGSGFPIRASHQEAIPNSPPATTHLPR